MWNIPVWMFIHQCGYWCPAASFTMEVNSVSSLAKCQLVFNGHLAKHGLTSSEKAFTTMLQWVNGKTCGDMACHPVVISGWLSNIKVPSHPRLLTCSIFNDEGSPNELTHWGRVMHICVSKLTIIGSDNGLSPCQRQAIVWTNAGILSIGPLGTNLSEIFI